MTYRGEVKNGVVVLELGACLDEGTKVRVEPIENHADSMGPSVLSDDARRSAAAAKVPDEQLTLLRRATEPTD